MKFRNESRDIHEPKRRLVWLSVFLFAASLLIPFQRDGGSAHAENVRGLPPKAAALPVGDVHEGVDTPRASTSDDDEVDYRDPVSLKGQGARGFYFNKDVVKAIGAEGVINVVRNARMNAAVIDMKDEKGHVSFPTQVPDLQKNRRVRMGNVKVLFSKLKAEGIYVIGRIVCFSDPLTPTTFPERGIHDSRPYKNDQLWGNWARNHPWLDPYNEKNHDMIVALAKEVEALGADEIQLDYVRFPVDESTKWARFPAKNDKPRSEVIFSMLEKIDRAVHIPVGVDVFGLTTMPWGRPQELGQLPELWKKHVEVFSPMLYLNGMRAWHDKDRELRAERLIALGVSTMRGRIGDEPVIRPYLQGFPQGADHYDVDFMAEQIRGAKRASADGFLFWHPASHYDVVREASVSGPAKNMHPFAIEARAEVRKKAWEGAAPR
jgi:hypothetical protein